MVSKMNKPGINQAQDNIKGQAGPLNEAIENKKLNKSPQYLRTDRAIVESFCKLLEKKPYEDITVQHILDAVPISRAAFYQHFQDKEAIAEQMLDEYIELQRKVKKKLGSLPQNAYAAEVQAMSEEYRPMIRALMQIHTDRVDLVKAIERELYRNYKRVIRTAEDELSAQIYAAAMAAFQKTMLYLPEEQVSDQGNPELFNKVMINAFLKIMKWENDSILKKMLMEKKRGRIS